MVIFFLKFWWYHIEIAAGLHAWFLHFNPCYVHQNSRRKLWKKCTKITCVFIIYLPTLMPAGWKLRSHAGSRLIEKCELLPLAWHNFQKYVNSDLCKERKPCVKWINDNTFLAISNFWSEKLWERARVYMRLKTGTRTLDVFGRLRNSLEDFRLLPESSEMIGLSSKIPALPG